MKFNRLYGGLLMAVVLFVSTLNISASSPDHAIPNSTAQIAPGTDYAAPVSDLMESPPVAVSETAILTENLHLERVANPISYSEPTYVRPPISPGYAPRIDQPPLANVALFTNRYHAAVDCQFKHR